YQTTFQTWDKLAAAYQDKFMDLDLYDDTYDLFCQFVEKQNPAVFEIGCGPGNVTRYLLNKRPDFKIHATDVAPSMVELAQKNNPTAHCSVMDCREINTLASRFDGILCGFCMPYLSKEDCEKLIEDCGGLLNSGGILYFSAIEDDYQKSGFETSSDGQHTMYVYYHQADYLKKALEKSYFEVVAEERKTYSKNNGTSSTHLIIIAKQKHT
ncbi:MAG: class I SAM-dependent methyltransferase, partial [Saprospiraceae bacterium]|nr:class I SAM-dependent methyltransferase [Saprospiraceae bacterium]